MLEPGIMLQIDAPYRAGCTGSLSVCYGMVTSCRDRVCGPPVQEPPPRRRSPAPGAIDPVHVVRGPLWRWAVDDLGKPLPASAKSVDLAWPFGRDGVRIRSGARGGCVSPARADSTGPVVCNPWSDEGRRTREKSGKGGRRRTCDPESSS